MLLERDRVVTRLQRATYVGNSIYNECEHNSKPSRIVVDVSASVLLLIYLGLVRASFG